MSETCECGHFRTTHQGGAGSCPAFVCCTADHQRDDSHDFVLHQPQRCACDAFVDAYPPAPEPAPAPAPYGLKAGISDEDYHADPATLSSTGARRLLECPARFRWERDNPRPASDAFDLGKVTHGLVLGEGGEVHVVHAADWRTKLAQEQRAACRKKGITPVLKADYDAAVAMRDAVMAHPTAADVFAEGHAELSGYWVDEATWVGLRFRPDWLTVLDGQVTCVDLKTTVSADPREFARSVAKFGYHAQAAWYLDGLAAHGVDDARFLFVCVEKSAPYPVSVVELDADAIAEGYRVNRAAIDLYNRCMTADEWPSYGDYIHEISLPQWAFRSAAQLEGTHQ